jgi:hypothetical protein
MDYQDIQKQKVQSRNTECMLYTMYTNYPFNFTSNKEPQT